MAHIDPPDIDSRDATEVARQTTELAKNLTRWSPGEPPDPGRALIDAFASMARQVITRLNQMPNRQFLAYLRMLGLQPQPPRAAEVPLTFTVSAGAKGVRVPAKTQVRGQHPDGTAVTFYTGNELELLPSREPILWRAVTYQPPDNGIDHVSMVTAKATGKESGYYNLFVGDEPVEHAAYLAADEVLTAAGTSTKVQLSIEFASNADAKSWESLQVITSDDQTQPIVIWEYFSSDANDWSSLMDSSCTWTDDGSTVAQVDFDVPEDMASCALSAVPEAAPAYWIRACLTAWPSEAVPAWYGVTLTLVDDPDQPTNTFDDVAPDQILYNSVPLDTSKGYYPLGQQPAFNDSCTVVVNALPSASKIEVTVNVTTSDGDQPVSGELPTLSWQIRHGEVWHDIKPKPTFELADTPDTPDTTGTVSILKASGTATFTLSPVASDSLTLRMLLVSGSYGSGIVVVDEGTDEATVVDKGYQPPILSSITIGGSYTPSATPTCVTDNGKGLQQESFAQPVMPFQRRADEKPAFYLGFGESLGNASVSMYLEVGPLSGATPSDIKAAQDSHDGEGDDKGDDSNESSNAEPSKSEVTWEYCTASADQGSAKNWQPLQVEDGTHGFTQSGLLRFIAPADHVRSAQFSHVPLYWLRARLAGNNYLIPPQGGRVLPNSIIASNAQPISNEVLGSSRQIPDQTFSLTHTPILENPVLVVREPARPPDAEVAQLCAEFGPLAVVPAKVPAEQGNAVDMDDTADTDAVWVRWKQVGSFSASKSQDRHYTLDYSDGTVTFGNGENGKVPPAGKSNIVMARYDAGGGAVGNLPAGAINQLVTAIAHVAAVDNALASSGGADGEDSNAVMDWGPKVLRHRGRATARQDYEDLVRQSFPQIVKVSAITPFFDPTMPPDAESTKGIGQVHVVIVPDSGAAPSAGLLQQVGDFLRTRMPPAVQLTLSGPDWLTVSVKAKVVAKGSNHAGVLEAEVNQALQRFLNPLTGGFNRNGWALGQMVYDSDLIRHVLALPGVDSVSALTSTRTTSWFDCMSEDTADQDLTAILVCSGEHFVKATPPSGSA